MYLPENNGDRLQASGDGFEKTGSPPWRGQGWVNEFVAGM